MTSSKIYLNVPYAQKDTAKALGAKWDATQKKWFVPADKEITLFAQWQVGSDGIESPTPTSKTKPASPATKSSSSAKEAATGVFTHPADKNFVAYSGVKPPWE